MSMRITIEGDLEPISIHDDGLDNDNFVYLEVGDEVLTAVAIDDLSAAVTTFENVRTRNRVRDVLLGKDASNSKLLGKQPCSSCDVLIGPAATACLDGDPKHQAMCGECADDVMHESVPEVTPNI